MNNLPLSGRTIVITRALAQADEFTHELEQYGAQVIACPTIEIQFVRLARQPLSG